MIKKIFGLKKFKAAICLWVLLIICTALFLTGCRDKPEEPIKPDFELDEVLITVKEEYRQKFLDKEFTVDDFNWENVKRIEYDTLYYEGQPIGFTVYLKIRGKNKVLSAVEHFKQLDFVEYAGPNYIYTIQK